jgi:hypothetical protein
VRTDAQEALAFAGGVAVLAAACVFGGGAAAAQQPVGGTAPAYPGNTLSLEHPSPIVAGTVVRVRLSGHAEWNDPTDVSTIPYTVSMYLQDADIDASCSPSYGGQLSKSINLPLNASLGITGWVLSDDITINPAIPSSAIDWSAKSVPFAVRSGVGATAAMQRQRTAEPAASARRAHPHPADPDQPDDRHGSTRHSPPPRGSYRSDRACRDQPGGPADADPDPVGPRRAADG